MSNAFLNRFQSVRNRKHRVLLGQAIAGTVLVAVIAIGAIAAADFKWELDRPARTFLVGVTAVAALGFAVTALWKSFQRSGRPMTAAEIEAAFPELGQSVRTTVQYGTMQVDQVRSEGVATALVQALAERTHQRALPLTIEDIIPAKRLWLLAAGVGIGVLLMWGASSVDWEWHNATQRALLTEVPYRSLEVLPGDQLIDEGTAAKIDVALVGRTNRDVLLYTRPVGKADAEWTERKLEEIHETNTLPPSAEQTSRPRSVFTAQLNWLTKPVEYRVSAGELSSPTYRIDIRRPLQIEQLTVELKPPAYTGQSATEFLDGNLSALQGTHARWQVQFDKPVKTAELVFAPRRRPRDEDEPNEAQSMPLQMSGTTGTAEFVIVEDRNYAIVAEAADGTALAETKYRIRVREDQPPQLSFEEPNDGIEVHTLAELPMRIRVRDDYGLTKVGVIFQVNSEQEIPLISKDFEVVAAAAAEAATTGSVSPTTQATLEKILPLEVFELTQKDSVMYYAFAEDNKPDNPQRTETDIRFIDIRPFKRQYNVIDPDPMNGMGMGAGLKTLEELISRQRFGLNRTIQIERLAAVGKKPGAGTLDDLMKFETELAQNVRETALGLEARGFDDTELFYQAETAILAAVDSLSVGKWENATLQMRDALKALIEQRDRTASAILKNPDKFQLAAIRQFDRMQAQKIRRPKTDKEEARELIRRLEQLVHEEGTVVTGLDEEKPAGDPEKKPESTEPATEVQKEDAK